MFSVRIVSVINYKGGVGKTTLTANIGAELAFRGKKVLLIDLDPQASLTFSSFGLSTGSRISRPKERLKNGMSHLTRVLL
ncbi:ParA family protein [Streptomyces bacillaris]|uniref:ParA family protein n=1 Tax=Streptomyces bacillaris TaxID=68179 RepID=UPI0034660C0C